MKKFTPVYFFLFITVTHVNSQNIYYDATYLNNRFANNVFTTTKGFNREEDSLKKIDLSLQAQIKEIQKSDDIYKTDSINKLQQKRKDIVQPLKKIQEEKDDSLFSILKKYFPEIKENNSSSDITIIIQKNPFFTACSIKGSVKGGGGGLFTNLDLSNVASSIGGLDVTKYANAIADLMIERAKQELTIAFFNRFKKFAEKNPEFQVLFPKTSDNLSNLLTYTYPQMLPALRNGFFEDIKQITYHLDDVLDLPRYQSLLRDFPEIRIMIRSIRIVHEIETGASNAAEIIKEFAGFKEWSDTTSSAKLRSVGSCLKIAALFSESVRNDSSQSHTSDIWVPAKELKNLFYDSVLFKIYLGLIYQQSINDKIKYISGDGSIEEFKDILASQQADLFLFQNKLKEFFDLAGNVNTAFKNFSKKIDNDESPSNDDIYNYINTSIDIIEHGFSIVQIFHKKPPAADYIAIVSKSNNLYKNLYSKAYSQAINNAVDVLSMISDLTNKSINADSLQKVESAKGFTNNTPNDVKKLIKGNKFLNPVKDKSIRNATSNSVANTNPNVVKIVQHYNLQHITLFIEKAKPYALFMANMVEAKKEEQVKAALENAILPVGSSTIKKYARDWGNISVQSYIGAYYSLNPSKTSVQSAWTDKFGVIAPIGIAWTPGILSWRRGGSLSLFASAFDLGAIVDYKLKKDSTITDDGTKKEAISKDYKIQLGQIFSPGGYLVYGFPWNLPLSFGVGAQYGPGLSKIDAGDNAVITNPSWRWNTFLAVDIPFFNIMNKNKVKPSK